MVTESRATSLNWIAHVAIAEWPVEQTQDRPPRNTPSIRSKPDLRSHLILVASISLVFHVLYSKDRYTCRRKSMSSSKK